MRQIELAFERGTGKLVGTSRNKIRFHLFQQGGVCNP